MTPWLIPIGFAAILFTPVDGQNTRFNHFFPAYGPTFVSIRDNQCAALYALLKVDYRNSTDAVGTCPALLSCILENTSEAIKANMASASVVLGLMPTILTFLSSSSDELALLSRRRPLLAFFISCGSPAVNPIPTFVYPDPVSKLQQRKGRLLPHWLSTLTPLRAAALTVVEYLAILATVANTVTASWYTGQWSISTADCPADYLPLLWLCFSACVHIGNVLTLHLRSEIIRNPYVGRSLKGRVTEWICNEFSPCVIQDKLQLIMKKETILFMSLSWLASVGMVGYVVYGTVVFSSLMFVGK
jgi:hypothetical protein